MKTIDTVYEAWQHRQWDKEDPEEIEEVYRYFKLLLRKVDKIDVDLSDKLWDTLTIAQQRSAEIAFKDGYRLGYKFREEMEERS